MNKMAWREVEFNGARYSVDTNGEGRHYVETTRIDLSAQSSTGQMASLLDV